MRTGWPGLPYVAYAAAAAVPAVVWLVVWPQGGASHTGGLTCLVLRYEHGLTWALLAASALCGAAGWSAAGKGAAFAGLAAYATFVLALAGS